MSSVHLASEFVVVNCGAPGCAEVFAMSRRTYDETRAGRGWSCPSGHPRRWSGRTTEQRLRDAEATATHLADQLRAAEAEAEATRARLIRDRHRFANGVCPCCNRSFGNVRRHMETQHPDYDPGQVTVVTGYRCSCGREFGTPHGLAVHQGKVRHPDWTDPARGDYSRHLTRA